MDNIDPHNKILPFIEKDPYKTVNADLIGILSASKTKDTILPNILYRLSPDKRQKQKKNRETKQIQYKKLQITFF
jgi:hypothetical protein